MNSHFIFKYAVPLGLAFGLLMGLATVPSSPRCVQIDLSAQALELPAIWVRPSISKVRLFIDQLLVRWIHEERFSYESFWARHFVMAGLPKHLVPMLSVNEELPRQEPKLKSLALDAAGVRTLFPFLMGEQWQFSLLRNNSDHVRWTIKFTFASGVKPVMSFNMLRPGENGVRLESYRVDESLFRSIGLPFTIYDWAQTLALWLAKDRGFDYFVDPHADAMMFAHFGVPKPRVLPAELRLDLRPLRAV